MNTGHSNSHRGRQRLTLAQVTCAPCHGTARAPGLPGIPAAPTTSCVTELRTDAPTHSANPTSVVEAKRVTKRVRDGSGRRTIIEDVSFGLGRGELVVLRGPSGSGKTTLLALLGAMLSPTSGEVILDGEPTSRLREVHRAELRRHKVGFVFQDHQLVAGMSLRDNVLLPCVPDGVFAPELRAAVAHSKVEALAGGERQRAAIARALMRDPPLLLLDEPTAHLDDARAGSLFETLAGLAGEGRAVLVATHDPRLVAMAAVSRVLDLVDGRLVSSGLENKGSGGPRVPGGMA
jgi:putative ABC transport system ATP-binding protein